MGGNPGTVLPAGAPRHRAHHRVTTPRACTSSIALRDNDSDWDPSGVHLFSALAEDVTAFAAVDAPGTEVVFERLAVTEQQIADHGLPTAPPKASDQRSFSGTSTTQAEALLSSPPY